ncbi:MAG: hypothetical protein N2645_07370 [Clostridia bacterium]|nr:hypothetical protein [Clostridia bacterium]
MFKKIVLLLVMVNLVLGGTVLNCFADANEVNKLNCSAKVIEPKYVKKEVNVNGIIADLYYNESARNQRVIMLLGGSFPGKSWSGDMDSKTRMDLLARGYALLSMAYFGMEGLPPTLQSIPLEYFEKSIDWVLKQPGIDRSGVAVMGGSKGGEAALLIASYFPRKVKAVVGLVPASNVFQGLGPGEKSSWSYKGKNLSFAPFIYNENYKKALEIWETEHKDMWVEVYRDALRDPEAERKSAIPIERAKCPVFLLSGKLDTSWPSFNMCESLIKRLKENHYKYSYQHVSYDHAGHYVAFEVPESWQKVLKFLEIQYPVKKTCHKKCS